ncbi:hypothetical protein O1L55_34070 [Streptomyces albulus]|nr:hypothetical protein [Streptomyces noursei]
MGPGDLLPTESDDLRLEPGFSGEDAPPPNSPVAEGMAADVADTEEAVVVPARPRSSRYPAAAASARSPRNWAWPAPGSCRATACTPPPTAGKRPSARRPRWPRRPPPPA